MWLPWSHGFYVYDRDIYHRWSEKYYIVLAVEAMHGMAGGVNDHAAYRHRGVESLMFNLY